MRLIELSHGAWRAEVAPEVGGSLFAFWQRDAAGSRIDWMRPGTPQALAQRNPRGLASFPLVPFCNRIRDGRASFEGREIRFPPNHPDGNSPHPLHGIGWQRPWQVVATETSSAELELSVAASAAWPWSFSSRQRYSLTASGLQVELSVTNQDTAAMPAGIGHHPYFAHPPGTRLTTDTRAMWRADDEVLPLALDAGHEAVPHLRGGVNLSELVLDNNFTGWQRHFRVDWPAQGSQPARSLSLRAQAPLDYFVLYSPRGADYFCAEPVSQCTDWLNLQPRFGPQDVGGARLEPGQTLTASFTVEPASGA